MRWVARCASEVRGVRLDTAQLTLASLASLRAGSLAGAHALCGLFEELGHGELVEVVEDWLASTG